MRSARRVFRAANVNESRKRLRRSGPLDAGTMAAWLRGYVCGLLLASCHVSAAPTMRLEKQELLGGYRAFCSKYRCCPQETDHESMDCSARNASELQEVSIPAPITSLSLRHNRITQLQPGSFAVAPTLSRLDLSFNKIDFISQGWWTSGSGNPDKATSGLKSLSLANNAVQSVNSSSFEGLSTLLALDLSYNRIRVLRGESFVGLTNLEELVVDHNPIYFVRGDAFATLPQLRELQMNFLDRLVLPPNAFGFVPAITTLGMAGNKLEDVPEQSLRSLKSLRSLDLSRNPFKVITDWNLQDLPNLSTLRLNDLHKLSKVEANAFGVVPRLKELHLSYNPLLTELEPEVFHDAENNRSVQLSGLYLRHTGLRSLSPKLLDWNQIVDVDLSENAWRCDCRLSWMASLAQRLPAEHRPRCAAPFSVEGRAVGDLRPYEFTCGDTDSSGLGSSIAMLCILIVSAAAAALGMAIYKRVSRKDGPAYRTVPGTAGPAVEEVEL
ncbi:uncharacterized protein LOC119171378 [Rhipicephalus microplus]|uniref:uncharacterized protein LOC119171378 n=1 Tax=Rhipicephalus microplus TaxID=6941 RepID=UPI003F6D845B